MDLTPSRGDLTTTKGGFQDDKKDQGVTASKILKAKGVSSSSLVIAWHKIH